MEVHICPIKMRTVKFIDGNCTEKCEERGSLMGFLETYEYWKTDEFFSFSTRKELEEFTDAN